MKTFKHKTTKEIAKLCKDDNNFYRVNDSLVMPKRFIENTNDWTEIIEEKLCVPIKTKFQYSNINPDSATIYTIDSVEKDIVKITWGYDNSHSYRNISQANAYFKEKIWTIYREYEILSLRTNTFTAITCSSIDIDAFLNKEKSTLKWQIKSIKRVSDNAIFTIGDIIKGKSGCICTIHEIWLNPDCKSQILFNHKDEGIDLINAAKYVFKSDDDKDIFIGDTYWTVTKSALLLSKNIAGKENKTNAFKYFLSKGKAENYINMNKVCFSINDISNYFIISPDISSKLLDVAKSKL